MKIKYVRFDDDEQSFRGWFESPERIERAQFLLELQYLMHNLQKMGLHLEYESKFTLKHVEKEAPEAIKLSKELFLNKLKNNSKEISEFIRVTFDLSEDIIDDIDGFLSEYADKNESLVDTIKTVRNRLE